MAPAEFGGMLLIEFRQANGQVVLRGYLGQSG